MFGSARYFPQFFIATFLGMMLFTALHLDISIPWIINDSIVRLVMNGILVLSLVPMLNAGVGINFGLPVGIVTGLLGMCLAVNWKIAGLLGFFSSIGLMIPFGVCFGFIFGKILNKSKGREEICATFVGFSFIPLMNFFWAVAPFSNTAMLWPIGGAGLRPTIGLKSYFAHSLNRLWLYEIGEYKIPCGLLLFFASCCLLVSLFFKTRIGRGMKAVGENEAYATLAGVNVEQMRVIAVIMSTVLAGVGICVYAQSYGFLELYDAPMMMAMPAASAILVGGCMKGRTNIGHVVVGTFLFHTTYVLSGPLANELLVSEVAEITDKLTPIMVIIKSPIAPISP